MPSTYKTPGVYVEEINKFPPSVAPVATAIPAFLGYTEKAANGNISLLLKPTRLSSLLEFETYFGGAPPREVNALHIDANNAFSSVEMESRFYLYDALRLFFQNGGGSCYIVAIGTYMDGAGSYSPNQLIDYQDGLAALKLVDEPTLIASPDAINVDPISNFYDIQKEILQQCANLQDRFAILDLLEAKPGGSNFGFPEGVDEFRQQIGMTNLKYGAAYAPHLQTNLPIPVTYALLRNKIKRGGVTVSLGNLTSDSSVQSHLSYYGDLLDLTNGIYTDISTLIGTSTSLEQHFQMLLDTARLNNGSGTAGDNELDDVFGFLYALVDDINTWGGGTTFPSLRTDIQNLAASRLAGLVQLLVEHEKEANTVINTSSFLHNASATVASWWTLPPLTSLLDSNTFALNGLTDVEDQRPHMLQLLQGLFTQLHAGTNMILDYAENYIREYENTLYQSHTVYRQLVQSLQGYLSTLPPSGAIAGIYARVDRDRGVWKAPANVSIAGIKELTYTIDNNIQDDLNVDPTAGKSINAIRTFTGKGILVWGARTLAGNDNEWRYIPVRRFFIMAEESIRKATEAFVFEANDANTWIRVRAMIENFLTLQWRAGALAGATPEQAFFVHVGLGLTMTNQDILEGRMIVEIGMAAVRPAEFIVLRFSHKMQES